VTHTPANAVVNWDMPVREYLFQWKEGNMPYFERIFRARHILQYCGTYHHWSTL